MIKECTRFISTRYGESRRPAPRHSVYCLSARGKPWRNCGKCPAARLAIMQMPRRAVCMFACCGPPVHAADSHGELCTAHAVLCMAGVSQHRDQIARSRACHHRSLSRSLNSVAIAYWVWHIYLFFSKAFQTKYSEQQKY